MKPRNTSLSHLYPTKHDFEQACKEGNFNSVVFLEKDFWTCWILQQIHHLVTENPISKINPRLTVKGSFSNSKAYKTNLREYVDLDFLLPRKDIGFSETLDELMTWNEKKIYDYRQELLKSKVNYMTNHLYPNLLERCIKLFGDGWSLKTEKIFDPVILFDYPKVLSGEDYSKNDSQHWIKIDIDCAGELSFIEKYSEMKTVRPYIYDLYQNSSLDISTSFLKPDYVGKFLNLLYYHRIPEDQTNKLSLARMIRVSVYYDIAFSNKNTELNFKDNVIDPELLEFTVNSQKIFYKEFGRITELPDKNKTFKLTPPQWLYSSIKDNYNKNVKLAKGTLPNFDEIIPILEKLEFLIAREIKYL